ncbi:MAG: bifunctional YncE family protein/alkaline phosphatase family protein, partial [Cyclobacteriaceae bacterium]|nr:bifunctional YncE family protein/alkaline phosphatase family protein [Cyclobacteriaceae bacterium]
MKTACCLALIALFVVLGSCKNQIKDWHATAPAGDAYTVVRHDSTTVLPNGRLLTPQGRVYMTAPHPFGLALSPDGKTWITSNSGVGPFSISIGENFNAPAMSVVQIPDADDEEEEDKEAEGEEEEEEENMSVFMGLAISSDGKVYVAGGQANRIYVYDIHTHRKLGEINCSLLAEGSDYRDGYIGEMAMTADGSRLFAVDQIGFRVVVVDTRSLKVVENIPTGRYPFDVALSPDEKSLYVANIGMYQYAYIKSLDKSRLRETAAKYPVFAHGSKEEREGIHSDSLEVSGLGDPNSTDAFSVWRLDISGPQTVVKAKIKTGILVGSDKDGIPAVGGSGPNSILATDKLVYVSNGSNDEISVIDPAVDSVVATIPLQLDPRLGTLKGVMPFGLALSPDQQRIFVAESGINAVAVIDVSSRRVLGHIPTAWFPSQVKVTPDGKQLIVSNAKGFGSGPNGGANYEAMQKGKQEDYIGVLMRGAVLIMDVPSDDKLAMLTQRVIDNNFKFTQEPTASSLWTAGGQPSPIQHVVFISKENRTYDDVFGQLTDGKGDATLARYGKDVSFANQKGDRRVDLATVMPNHLALAELFGISDNFYVDSDVSADGHVWLTNTYPTQWMETHHPAAYGGKRSQREESNAPGKFGMTGAAGAIFPESYNQHGSIWDHLFRNGKEFYNFGFGVEFDAGSFSDSTFKQGGVRYLVNYPLPGPLYDRTSRQFPTFNMAIPDQYRADVFIREVKEKYIDTGKPIPAMLTLQLLNDHGAGERPHAGFPFNESYMSDNDLALGRVIEFLSHTPAWKNMLIIVTEDDAQGGSDHVDAHRSVLMVISPYAKRNRVSHQHTSFGSIFKTCWQVLGVPSLNQYDFGANDLGDMLTEVPDYTPYNALPVDPRVFDPAKAMRVLRENFDWKAFRDSPVLDDPE